jgi:hypothetical protein
MAKQVKVAKAAAAAAIVRVMVGSSGMAKLAAGGSVSVSAVHSLPRRGRAAALSSLDRNPTSTDRRASAPTNRIFAPANG